MLEKGTCSWLPWGSVSRWCKPIKSSAQGTCCTIRFVLYNTHFSVGTTKPVSAVSGAPTPYLEQSVSAVPLSLWSKWHFRSLTAACCLMVRAFFTAIGYLIVSASETHLPEQSAITDSPVPTTPKLKDFGYSPHFFIWWHFYLDRVQMSQFSDISNHYWSCFCNDLIHGAFKHQLQFHWNPRIAGREINASFWLQITSVCSSEVSWNSLNQNQILLPSFSFYCDIKGPVHRPDQSQRQINWGVGRKETFQVTACMPRSRIYCNSGSLYKSMRIEMRSISLR